jgi:hypothetical protein
MSNQKGLEFPVRVGDAHFEGITFWREKHCNILQIKLCEQLFADELSRISHF